MWETWRYIYIYQTHNFSRWFESRLKKSTFIQVQNYSSNLSLLSMSNRNVWWCSWRASDQRRIQDMEEEHTVSLWPRHDTRPRVAQFNVTVVARCTKVSLATVHNWKEDDWNAQMQDPLASLIKLWIKTYCIQTTVGYGTKPKKTFQKTNLSLKWRFVSIFIINPTPLIMMSDETLCNWHQRWQTNV